MRTATALEARAFAERGHRVADLIEGLGTPVVAAVNGFALGGGCEIALACDVRLAADSARLGSRRSRSGDPGVGRDPALARATSIGFAKDLILSGRLVSAEEALRAGLVTHVHPKADLLDAAVELATQSPRVRLGRRLRQATLQPGPRRRRSRSLRPRDRWVRARVHHAGPARGDGRLLREAPAPVRGPRGGERPMSPATHSSSTPSAPRSVGATGCCPAGTRPTS